jgi:flavin-dependent dehydrogenase
MNERIKVLAEQAKFMTEEDINRQISYNTELKAFAEKFAELIVRECAEIADNADATREKWEGIGKYVREHFGVE